MPYNLRPKSQNSQMMPILRLQSESWMPFLTNKSFCQSKEAHRSAQTLSGCPWATSQTFSSTLKNSIVLHQANVLAVKGPKLVPDVQKKPLWLANSAKNYSHKGWLGKMKKYDCWNQKDTAVLQPSQQVAAVLWTLQQLPRQIWTVISKINKTA